MKKSIFIAIISFCTLLSNSTFAGSPQYLSAMKSAVSQLDSAYAPSQYLQLANTFERIAGVEKSEWLPDYYAAYCYAMFVFSAHDKKSVYMYMDKAEALINKADSIKPNNSEIITVKGLINSGRIMVDPMSRGKKYGIKANENYSAAMKLDS